MYRALRRRHQITETSRKILSENLIRYRTENNMSREHLALLCCVDIKYLSRIEWGTANTSLDILDKISNGTGIPAWELLIEQK